MVCRTAERLLAADISEGSARDGSRCARWDARCSDRASGGPLLQEGAHGETPRASRGTRPLERARMHVGKASWDARRGGVSARGGACIRGPGAAPARLAEIVLRLMQICMQGGSRVRGPLASRRPIPACRQWERPSRCPPRNGGSDCAGRGRAAISICPCSRWSDGRPPARRIALAMGDQELSPGPCGFSASAQRRSVQQFPMRSSV